MRISNQMMSATVMANMNASLDRLSTLQNQASSGKRITKASDDPMGTSQALNLRSSVNGITQYAKNASQAKSQLSLTDSSLSAVSKALQDAKTAALTGANATTDDATRKTLAEQVQQQMDNIVSAMNATDAGRHIFSGYATSDNPLSASASGPAPYTYNGDDGVARVQVNDSTTVDVGVTAKAVLNFGGAADPAAPDTLSVLKNLKDALNSGDQKAIQDGLKQLEGGIDNVTTLRGKIGAQASQMDVYSNRLGDAKVTVTHLLSDVEDVDIAGTLTNLQAEQNVYQSSLIAASRMIQPSLADYLK